MYVNKIDYVGRITMSLLDILLAEDPDTILADASKSAEDTISSMAGVLYDIDPELAKTGADRNGYILGFAKSIGLYFIYQRADDNQIPEKVIKNYDDALEDLERISVGKKALTLPPKNVANNNSDGGESVTPEGNGLRRMGSQDKKTHQI